MPQGETVESLSVFPLPYKGSKEIFVECTSKKRFRLLATLTHVLSEFTEMDFPQKGPQISTKGVN